ncbi:MAG: Lrp/AsnC family transcriptional regulator [Thermodesulfobacteriota bacterium]
MDKDRDQKQVRDFTEKEKRILRLVQDTLPDSSTPFASIAHQAGVQEADVLKLLMELKNTGCIRRFGATLRHQEAGYDCNVMVAWQVPRDRIQEISLIMSARPEITHCYQRRSTESWPFNLYTMIHAKSKDNCLQLIKDLADTTGLDSYEALFSIQELKKTSMRYF